MRHVGCRFFSFWRSLGRLAACLTDGWRLLADGSRLEEWRLDDWRFDVLATDDGGEDAVDSFRSTVSRGPTTVDCSKNEFNGGGWQPAAGGSRLAAGD